MNITDTVVIVFMSADNYLVAWEVLSCKLPDKYMRFLWCEIIFITVLWIKANNIVVCFDLWMCLIFPVVGIDSLEFFVKSVGIIRIKQLCEEGLKQPDFEVSENTIKIVLPVFEKNQNLTEDERKIYKLLSRTMLKSISEITPYVDFGKSKTT